MDNASTGLDLYEIRDHLRACGHCSSHYGRRLLAEVERLRDGIRAYLAVDGSQGRYDALERNAAYGRLVALLDDRTETR